MTHYHCISFNSYFCSKQMARILISIQNTENLKKKCNAVDFFSYFFAGMTAHSDYLLLYFYYLFHTNSNGFLFCGNCDFYDRQSSFGAGASLTASNMHWANNSNTRSIRHRSGILRSNLSRRFQNFPTTNSYATLVLLFYCTNIFIYMLYCIYQLSGRFKFELYMF